jgi:hypothetical protein
VKHFLGIRNYEEKRKVWMAQQRKLLVDDLIWMCEKNPSQGVISHEWPLAPDYPQWQFELAKELQELPNVKVVMMLKTNSRANYMIPFLEQPNWSGISYQISIQK